VARQVMTPRESSLDLTSLPNGESKLRGGYYTPPVIAQFLAKWAIHSVDAAVLEPSCGDGALVAPAADLLDATGKLVAVELFASEAEIVARHAYPSTEVVNGDVFTWYQARQLDGSFDAVIGNPPFIRYQSFPEEHRIPSFKLMNEEGLRPTRLTNAWVPFVVLATRALRVGGRLALVLPAELLQVSYTEELREYLNRKYSHLTIVTFRRLVFNNIQQETILLLGIRGDGSRTKISFVELDDPRQLNEDHMEAGQRAEVDLDHGREKWTQYYLTPKQLGLIREIEASNAFTSLGELADVDVGVVTGRNEFFVLSPGQAKTLGVEEYCQPLVGRSAQIPGLVLRHTDWDELSAADSRCLLMQLGPRDRSALSAAALSYVRQGEAKGLHQGYKCRIRLPRWWNVPSVWNPDAFLLRQIHNGPRIIVNQAAATCTDTIHRIRVKGDTRPQWLAAASMNSLTFAFSEIRGRSYGGGVLELEPTEAEALPFPRPGGVLPLEELDLWARRKDPDQVLDEVDRLVLRPAGLSGDELRTLRDIWRKLSNRRLDRKRR
jgi:adenine-specific DNA-methyltransferase